MANEHTNTNTEKGEERREYLIFTINNRPSAM